MNDWLKANVYFNLNVSRIEFYLEVLRVLV
jgi:hypothetical protein